MVWHFFGIFLLRFLALEIQLTPDQTCIANCRGWAPLELLTGPRNAFRPTYGGTHCSDIFFCQPLHDRNRLLTQYNGVDSRIFFSLVQSRQVINCWRDKNKIEHEELCTKGVGSLDFLTGPEYRYWQATCACYVGVFRQDNGSLLVDHKRIFSRGWAPHQQLTGLRHNTIAGLDTLTDCSNTAVNLFSLHHPSGLFSCHSDHRAGNIFFWILTLAASLHLITQRGGSFLRTAKDNSRYRRLQFNTGVGSLLRFSLALGFLLFHNTALYICHQQSGQHFYQQVPDSFASVWNDSRGTASPFFAGVFIGINTHCWTSHRHSDYNWDWAPRTDFSGPNTCTSVDPLHSATTGTGITWTCKAGVGSLHCDSLVSNFTAAQLRLNFFRNRVHSNIASQRVGSSQHLLAQHIVQFYGFLQIIQQFNQQFIFLIWPRSILTQTDLQPAADIHHTQHLHADRPWLHTHGGFWRQNFLSAHTEADTSAVPFTTRLRCSPGPKSRNTFHCQYHQILSFFGCVRSEGCISVMGDAEVPPAWTPELLLETGTKPHDPRPGTRFHATTWHPAPRPIVKRSIKRAYNRALQHGVAWYRGRCLTPSDFPKALQTTAMTFPEINPTMRQNNLLRCNQQHQEAKRFRLLQWNAGGLSLHRLDAIKVWMFENHIDAAMIVETRWTYESEWADSLSHYIHTGDPSHRGMGILCILSKRLCKAEHIRWRVLLPGRLVHVQVQMHNRNLDLVGCYQHTRASHASRMQERTHWWNQLDSLLHSLAHRNVLALTGDFNCNLVPSPTHSGPDQYRWRGHMTAGAMHQDAGHFTSLLRMHGLTALNSWDPGLGPTYVHANHHSRIDFIITRKTVADGVAKRTCYAWDAPFCNQHDGHVPMIAQLRKTWYHVRDLGDSITSQQLRTGYHAFRQNSDVWQRFVATAANDLATLDPVQTSDDNFFPNMHARTIRCFQHFFHMNLHVTPWIPPPLHWS